MFVACRFVQIRTKLVVNSQTWLPASLSMSICHDIEVFSFTWPDCDSSSGYALADSLVCAACWPSPHLCFDLHLLLVIESRYHNSL